MTKPVRKSARLTSTVLGGVCWIPRALRRNDSTMMMRVNDVTVMRIAGARLSTVTSTMSWMIRPVGEPEPAAEPGKEPEQHQYGDEGKDEPGIDVEGQLRAPRDRSCRSPVDRPGRCAGVPHRPRRAASGRSASLFHRRGSRGLR